MPFGAALVRDGVLLRLGQNNQVTAHDPSGHAEVSLLRDAWAEHGPDIARGATVYASGEPCAMCSGTSRTMTEFVPASATICGNAIG